MEIPRVRAKWKLGKWHGDSKVHCSIDGRTTVCGKLIPTKIAKITYDEPAISCGKCREVLETHEHNRKYKEKRVKPTIRYKGPHGDFIKLYNDMQGIAAWTKGEKLTPEILEQVKNELRDRLVEEVKRGAIEAGTLELDVKRDPDDPKRLIVDFLPVGDALEETQQDLPPADPSKRDDEQGLISKYFVFKVEGTGAPDILMVGPDDAGGTIAVGAWMKKTRVFVLSPEKDDQYGLASRTALTAYAAVIHDKNPKLAQDLLDWLKRIPS